MSDVELDPVIHSQARLRVVAALAQFHRGDAIAFTKLQEVLGMTAGNLSTHLRKLEEIYDTASLQGHGLREATINELMQEMMNAKKDGRKPH